jgi:hypothetical protein
MSARMQRARSIPSVRVGTGGWLYEVMYEVMYVPVPTEESTCVQRCLRYLTSPGGL